MPAVASADLVNEYGMHFVGKTKCVECHSAAADATVHGRMARTGINPTPPAEWTMFKSAGDAPQVPGTAPAVWAAGGEYPYDMPWITLGDNTSGLATEYLFWRGSADPTVMPWNLVEGLVYENGEWMVGESPSGLYDVTYACQRCHQLGSTNKATKGEIVPNPEATIAPTATTAVQWARDASKSVADFMSDPTVSQAGMSIQCESCHGTGAPRPPATTAPADKHWNSGTQLSHRMADTTWRQLAHSQVCGQCHGSYTAVTGTDGKTTLGVYGYTPNLPFRTFGDINGLSGGASYTYIPTDAEFKAAPTKFFMFPNGSNAKGNHFYYNEWSASMHSWRGALQPTDPDASAYQATGASHYNATGQSTIDSKCYRCHTGEGYLESKGVINKYLAFDETFTATKDNTGFLGQECSTCHGGHPASKDEADVVRAPDKAGQRSATGLAMDNQSICEDCHNWQFEVQGTSPSYRPEAPGARVGPSHPQREMLRGKAMVDIPAADEFMPGVKCEDCHMPKTNKNANRYSHGMKPMLPGDAQTWMTAAGSAYMGQDSCSSCHPAQTRTELQDTLDLWQGRATVASTSAYAEINAAKARPEFDGANSSSPGYILVGRATWNYKAWQNDASGGAHNPEYVVDGLQKAKQMAKSVGGSFFAVQGPVSVLPGGNALISGKVVNGDGSPAADATVQISSGGTVMTSANGGFAFLVNPAVATTYSVTWVRSSGDARANLTSPGVTVAMAKYASTTTIAKSASSVTTGKSVKISGKVTSSVAVTGKVKIYFRKGTSGSWKYYSVTLSSGSYSKSITLSSKGTWYFKSEYLGTSTIATSKAAEISVNAK
jgi:hypothetical protein